MTPRQSAIHLHQIANDLERDGVMIVDEAGQVVPEVTGGLLAFAQRALIVGDAYQLSPIWNIVSPIDLINLQTYKLATPEPLPNTSPLRGYTASEGSLLALAHTRTTIQKPPRGGCLYLPGLFLAEHRRCVPEIIGYCNELAYQGGLIPKRPSMTDDEKFPCPHLGYWHIKGKSENNGGSRVNRYEAMAIIYWLDHYAEHLLNYYQQRDPNKVVKLTDIIAIITPFSAQKNEILSQLRKTSHSIGVVGTVHALQGGERPIVLFSPVYSASEQQVRYFFDLDKPMLNVAVSRAKDSFIVIGDADIFNPHRDTPSGILARHLFRHPENEFTTLSAPPRSLGSKQ